MKKLEQSALGAGILVLFTTLVFVCGLAGAGAAIAAALSFGAAFTFAWVRSHLPHARLWILPIVVAACALLAALVLQLAFGTSIFAILSAPVAGLASLAVLLQLHWNRERCDLCNRRLRTQSVVFHCPRCRLRVCEESCWSFEHRRCRLCLEQRVPVLPPQDKWWLRSTGPRVEQGRCQVCLAGAAQTDLRACPHCRRLQCRECWDFHNGSCTRCSGTLPELPETLHMAVAEVTD